jgi:UDP-glucose 4-epimerase
VAVNKSPARPGEQQRSTVDISKARDVLGWTPQVALADGLKATYDFFAGQQ